LAAHAAQFAFLNFFENPHIERRYGVRKILAKRTPIVFQPRARTGTEKGTPNIGHSISSSHTDIPNGRLHHHHHHDQLDAEQAESITEEVRKNSIPRSRSFSWGTTSSADADTTVIDSEEAIGEEREPYDRYHRLPTGLLDPQDQDALRIASEGVLASITPPNRAREVVQEAVTQHDLLNKFFRGDVIVLSGLDLLR
jgi:phosphatidylethanolamine N-methyltransferase